MENKDKVFFIKKQILNYEKEIFELDSEIMVRKNRIVDLKLKLSEMQYKELVTKLFSDHDEEVYRRSTQDESAMAYEPEGESI